MISDHRQPPAELNLPRKSPHPANPLEKGTKTATCTPPNLLRLKTTPIPCFQSHTGNFNRTMLRLNTCRDNLKFAPPRPIPHTQMVKSAQIFGARFNQES